MILPVHAKRTERRGAALALSLAVSLLANVAAAQGSASVADTQFDYGLAEMKAGRYDTGCPALAESYRLDPKPGSLFTLAECETRAGKLATALTHYEAYLDVFSRMTPDQQNRQWGREKIAATRRDELRARVPSLTLVGHLPDGSVIKRDGVPIGPALIGATVPIDPGPHVVEISVPGKPLRREELDVPPGKAVRISVDDGDDDARLAAAGGGDASSPSAMRTGAIVAASVGAAGLVVGTAFGVVTLGHKSTIDSHCVDTACDAEGKSAADASATTGAVSTVGFVVGVIGLGTGAALYFLDPSRPRAGAKSGKVTVVPWFVAFPGGARASATLRF